ncbi:MAG: NAD-dependent deacylase [Dehalococcoidia bacterium]|nr:NAD-dependent deacylase [Dehalococcoidia bacterium]
MTDDLEQAIDEAAHLIVRARHVVALVGAGLSAESGVPTFRGPEGLWTKHGEPDLRDYERFAQDPKTWWEQRIERAGRYGELVRALETAQPNAGHYALRDLEGTGQLQHIITQNIDNLHQAAGSLAITEIHGNRTKLRCINCNRRWPLDGFPIEELPPHCPDCGGIVKGDTVMFGEPIPHDALEECVNQTRMCDCMLLVGTSAVVYPAAGFPVDVKTSGGTLIECNPNETPLTEISDVVLRAPAGAALPRVAGRVREMSVG